jgi:hypothetical protein
MLTGIVEEIVVLDEIDEDAEALGLAPRRKRSPARLVGLAALFALGLLHAATGALLMRGLRRRVMKQRSWLSRVARI